MGFLTCMLLLTLKKKLNTTSNVFFDVAGYHGNYQIARATDDVREYIMKYDQHPYEHGLYTGNSQSRVQKRAAENKAILAKPLNELIDEGIVHISQYKQYKEAINSYRLTLSRYRTTYLRSVSGSTARPASVSLGTYGITILMRASSRHRTSGGMDTLVRLLSS